MAKDEEYISMRLITGAVSTIKKSNLVGFCYCDTHKGWLTKEIIRKHECIEKKCPFLKKCNPEYWEALARNAEAKQQEKAVRKQKKQEQKATVQAWIQQAQETSENMKLYLKIYNVRQEAKPDTVTVFYTSYFDRDDSRSYPQYNKYLGRLWEKNVILRHIKNPDGSYAVLW